MFTVPSDGRGNNSEYLETALQDPEFVSSRITYPSTGWAHDIWDGDHAHFTSEVGRSSYFIFVCTFICFPFMQGLSHWIPELAEEISRIASGRKVCVVTDSTLTAHDYVVLRSAAPLGGA